MPAHISLEGLSLGGSFLSKSDMVLRSWYVDGVAYAWFNLSCAILEQHASASALALDSRRLTECKPRSAVERPEVRNHGLCLGQVEQGPGLRQTYRRLQRALGRVSSTNWLQSGWTEAATMVDVA